jgi:hypothetical protein
MYEQGLHFNVRLKAALKSAYLCEKEVIGKNFIGFCCFTIVVMSTDCDGLWGGGGVAGAGDNVVLLLGEVKLNSEGRHQDDEGEGVAWRGATGKVPEEEVTGTQARGGRR